MAITGVPETPGGLSSNSADNGNRVLVGYK